MVLGQMQWPVETVAIPEVIYNFSKCFYRLVRVKEVHFAKKNNQCGDYLTGLRNSYLLLFGV